MAVFFGAKFMIYVRITQIFLLKTQNILKKKSFLRVLTWNTFIRLKINRVDETSRIGNVYS